ncbi:anti-sigma factor family protein [Luteococcus sanguinis]|uniref:Anti-sigma factor family protein n=1 Tax=Luteococcus sanguinis TaxID=174038 RepID=A0ABW1X5Q8_9ACTN
MNECTAWRDELVAYADHALDGHTREVIARHLVGCSQCRTELAELQGVRTVVATAATIAGAPAGLADRLLAIAGDDAQRELCLGRKTQTALPSLRARRRQRMLVGTSGMVLVATGLLAGAWLLAPDLPDISDPDGSTLGLTSTMPTSTAVPFSAIPFSAIPFSAVGSAAQAAFMATPSSVDVDCPAAFSCPDEIDGMVLTSVVVDSATAPTTVRAVYADAKREVTVVQQRGRLSPGTAATAAGERIVWQSSDIVICVHSDESGHAQSVANALPHQSPADGGLGRIRAGLRSLVGQRGR